MNTEDKTNWLNEYGLVLFRNKISPYLVLQRSYEWNDRWLKIDEKNNNKVIRTYAKKDIAFCVWSPISKKEYMEKYMNNDLEPEKENVRFIYSPKKVEEMYKEHEDENTKIMDKAVDDYLDMVNKHPELAEIKHGSLNTPYFEEKWAVRKDTVYAAIEAVKNGLEYAEEALEQHELEQNEKTSSITRRDRIWAQQMEKDIEQMKITLLKLKNEPTK